MTEPANTPVPFSLHVGDDVLEDLRLRLARTRWPDEPPGPAWSTGSSVAYMQALAEHWRTGFDWREHEAALNRFRQFTVSLAGIDLHFIHEPGQGPAPLPLLLSHGWPGSVFEFRRLIPMLTDPGRVGGDPADALHRGRAVAPRLHAVVQAGAAALRRRRDGRRLRRADDRRARLPAFRCPGRRLGRLRHLAAGLQPSRAGDRHPPEPSGGPARSADAAEPDGRGAPSPRRAESLSQGGDRLPVDPGHEAADAGVRPERFPGRPGGLDRREVPQLDRQRRRPGQRGPRDEMLANITLYWATGAVGSSFWPYYARMHREWPVPAGKAVNVPMGYVEFPREILRPPRSVAARQYSDIRRWTTQPKGGHFAALEQPEVLAQKIREFFRPLRAAR